MLKTSSLQTAFNDLTFANPIVEYNFKTFRDELNGFIAKNTNDLYNFGTIRTTVSRSNNGTNLEKVCLMFLDDLFKKLILLNYINNYKEKNLTSKSKSGRLNEYNLVDYRKSMFDLKPVNR